MTGVDQAHTCFMLTGEQAVGQEALAKAEKNTIRVNEGAIAIAVSSLICFLGTQAAVALGWPDAGTGILESASWTFTVQTAGNLHP